MNTRVPISHRTAVSYIGFVCSFFVLAFTLMHVNIFAPAPKEAPVIHIKIFGARGTQTLRESRLIPVTVLARPEINPLAPPTENTEDFPVFQVYPMNLPEPTITPSPLPPPPPEINYDNAVVIEIKNTPVAIEPVAPTKIAAPLKTPVTPMLQVSPEWLYRSVAAQPPASVPGLLLPSPTKSEPIITPFELQTTATPTPPITASPLPTPAPVMLPTPTVTLTPAPTLLPTATIDALISPLRVDLTEVP